MSQKDFEIISTLKPLETLWSPLADDKIQIYCEHLQSFGIDVIRQAVKRVSAKWDRLTFPPIAVIVEACGIVNGTGSKGATVTNLGIFPWIQRAADQKTLIDEYVSRYMRDSMTAAQAKQENWDYQLRKYITAVARVQAQLIHPSPAKNLGVDWHIIEAEGLTRVEADKFHYGFIKDASRQAEKNCIDVAIPTHKIEQWQKYAKLEEAYQYQSKQVVARKYGVSLGDALPREPAQEVLPPIYEDFGGDNAYP